MIEYRCTSVLVDSHGSVSLSVMDLGSVGAVDGDLVVVGSQSVSMSVGVREQSALEHLVKRGFHAGNEMSGGES